MLVKNLPFGALFWIIPLRLALDVGAGIYFAYKEGISHLWAVFRGYFGFYAQLPESFRRRVKFQKKNYYQTKYLVLRYFIKK